MEGKKDMKISKVLAVTLAALTAGATMALGIFAAGLGDYVTTGTVGGFNALTSPMIVVGNSVDSTDTIAAADIAAAVAGYATTTVSTGAGANVAVSGGADLSTPDNKLYMGSVLTKARTTLTINDLPSLLAGGSISVAGTPYTYSEYITMGSGTVNYTAVTVANEMDPVLFVTMNSGSTGANTGPTYNATVVFNKPLNVTNSDVRGQTINLFGKDYTIGSNSNASTTGSILELYGYGATQDVYHAVETKVTVGGTEYTVKALINTNQQVLLYVNGVSDSSWRATSASTVVNGLNIYVKGVGYISSTDLTQNFAQLSLGSQKLTLTDGSSVTVGTAGTSVDGTLVDIIGSADGISTMTVSVAAADSSKALIKASTAFTDPVYGSFKVAFNGLTTDLKDSSRDVITATAGTTQTTVSFKDYSGTAKTITWALDSSGVIALNASANQAIVVKEGGTVNLNDYFVFAPSQESEFGHIFRLSQMNGIGGSSPKFALEDVIKGTSTTYDLPVSGSKTIYVDGQAVYAANASSTSMTFNWGTSASASSAGSKVTINPLIKLKNGEYMAFLDNITLTNETVYELPGNVSVNLTAAMLANNYETVPAGRIKYNFVNTTQNALHLNNVTDASGNVIISTFPAIIVLQEQDNATNKDVIGIATTERDTTNHYIGLSEPKYTDLTSNLQWVSNTYLKTGVDLFGTYVEYSFPASAGQTATIYYPDTQAVATVGVGASPAFAVGGAGTVNAAVKIQSPVAKFASEVSSTAPGADVILVGGPCANSLTAAVLASSNVTCANWAYTTGIIKEVTGAFTDGKKALVVAGTDAADTRNLAKMVMEGTLSYAV